jgi:hypothetical protein
MARDARLIISKAMDRLEARYAGTSGTLAENVIADVRAEIDYAFDLAQVPQTPGRKPKAKVE